VHFGRLLQKNFVKYSLGFRTSTSKYCAKHEKGQKNLKKSKKSKIVLPLSHEEEKR